MQTTPNRESTFLTEANFINQVLEATLPMKWKVTGTYANSSINFEADRDTSPHTESWRLSVSLFPERTCLQMTVSTTLWDYDSVGVPDGWTAVMTASKVVRISRLESEDVGTLAAAIQQVADDIAARRNALEEKVFND